MERWGFGALSFSVYWFSCLHLAFSPSSNQCSQKHAAHTAPRLCFRRRSDIIVGFVCKSSISYVLCHILSGRLSRCYDCTVQTVELLKAERETSTRWWVRERKGFGHIFREIKHLGAINRLQPALFQPLCCLWIINVNRDRFVYFECGTTGAEWQDE